MIRRVHGNIGNIHELPRFFHINLGVASYEKRKNLWLMYTKTRHEQGKKQGSRFAHILELFCSKIEAKKVQNGSNLTPKGAPGATRGPNRVGKVIPRATQGAQRDHCGSPLGHFEVPWVPTGARGRSQRGGGMPYFYAFPTFPRKCDQKWPKIPHLGSQKPHFGSQTPSKMCFSLKRRAKKIHSHTFHTFP